ncbi:diamine N-acetyltransferase [Chitinophaga sp. CF118]|uniref:GNAT family N-acetyltransferase n=1 Tax=Chitinophaga sp. CF118 TaxID=1884367 RepID=UPI0008F17676|nr:GNAT family N-acetyltransferase [Chitinophaga sp. CF118]SFD26464.1 diamine N-acetyltransferase [Chitinophaga sp. CF118]
MSTTIRRATEHDFPAILSLIKEFSEFQKTPDKVKITLEQMVAEKDYFRAFVVESNADIIGFATFFFTYYSWSGKALYLDDLYITSAFREQGIGKQLLDTIIQLAKNEQCKKVRWQVSGWNANAISFYKKMGAIIDDTEINCDLPL